MSHHIAQPQMEGFQHGTTQKTSIGRRPVGSSAGRQRMPNTQAMASPTLSRQSYSSTDDSWSPLSIANSCSGSTQNAEIPGSIALPTLQYTSKNRHAICSVCKEDASNDNSRFECLACTAAQQNNIFCTSCCVNKDAHTTHHHHISNFISISDTLLHDEAVMAEGWDARRSAFGVTWYQQRATKIRTFERPNAPATALQVHTVQGQAHIPVHAKSPSQAHQAIPSNQSVRSLQSTLSNQSGQSDQSDLLTQDISAMQLTQLVETTESAQYLLQNQSIEPSQPMQLGHYAQKTQPMRTKQSVSPIQSSQPPQFRQTFQPVLQEQPVQTRLSNQQVQATQSIETRQREILIQQKLEQSDPFSLPSVTLKQSLPATVSTPIQPNLTGELELPPGWEEIENPDGRVFYYYHATKLSTWTAPVCPLPEGWVTLKNPDGQIYYSNPTLDSIQWDRPIAAAPGENVNFTSMDSGQETFVEAVAWSPTTSAQSVSPTHEYSPSYGLDWENGRPSTSRRSSALSIESISKRMGPRTAAATSTVVKSTKAAATATSKGVKTATKKFRNSKQAQRIVAGVAMAGINAVLMETTGISLGNGLVKIVDVIDISDKTAQNANTAIIQESAVTEVVDYDVGEDDGDSGTQDLTGEYNMTGGNTLSGPAIEGYDASFVLQEQVDVAFIPISPTQTQLGARPSSISGQHYVNSQHVSWRGVGEGLTPLAPVHEDEFSSLERPIACKLGQASHS